MRCVDQPEPLEIRHDVAHRGWRQCDRQEPRQVARAHRLASGEIAFDDLAENLPRTLVEGRKAHLVRADRNVVGSHRKLLGIQSKNDASRRTCSSHAYGYGVRPAKERIRPMRPSRRQVDELRAVSLERGVVKHAEGSCFVKFGDTHVLVTASLEERLPLWLKGQSRGWITAEYGMLPRATAERTRREASAGKQGGRTVEIQRLIGRSLRSVVDLAALGERQIMLDCDVIKADVLRDHIAAVSCGVCKGTAVLDLDYAEDSDADTDANFVMTGSGNIVEIQATAEKIPFSEDQFAALLALARKGIDKLVSLQKMAVM